MRFHARGLGDVRRLSPRAFHAAWEDVIRELNEERRFQASLVGKKLK